MKVFIKILKVLEIALLFLKTIVETLSNKEEKRDKKADTEE